MRIVSGIKPTGRPHLGNYLGAMKQHIQLQNEHECYFFVADYHALTTVRNKEQMLEYRRGVVLDYLALGLDPNKATLFFQSDLPEHAELAWVLSTVAPVGLLERAHAWKDAKAKGDRDMNVGLFTYPVLMAADILLYQAEGVPVGKDQKQHVEIARDIAEKFNHFYGDTFVLPEPMIEEGVATVPGTDGQKMSKSYNNIISLFDDEKTIQKQIMSVQTQSLPLEAKMPTKDDLILQLYQSISSPEEYEVLAARYEAGNFGYGNAKKELLKQFLEHFAEARTKRMELERSKDWEAIVEEGAKKAKPLASATLNSVYSAIGLN